MISSASSVSIRQISLLLGIYDNPNRCNCPLQVILSVLHLLCHYESKDSKDSLSIALSNVKQTIENVINNKAVQRKLMLFIQSLSESDRRLLPSILSRFIIPSTSIPLQFIHEIIIDRDVILTQSASKINHPMFLSFSESKRWKVQHDYYENSAIDAWNANDVPHAISSNRFVAKLIINNIIQQLPVIESSHIYHIAIVEVGAGHGLLSYLIARELYIHRNEHKHYIFHVICTDFHAAMFDHMRSLPWVQELICAGILDFAICGGGDVDVYKGLDFFQTKVNSMDMIWNHLFIIGNYAFDSFPSNFIYKSKIDENIYEIGVIESTCSNLLDDNSINVKKCRNKSNYALRKLNVDDNCYSSYDALSPGVYVHPVVGNNILQVYMCTYKFY
jgi:hypothetical protein